MEMKVSRRRQERSDRQFLTVGLHVPVHAVQPALAGEVRVWRSGVDGVVQSGLSYTLLLETGTLIFPSSNLSVASLTLLLYEMMMMMMMMMMK